MFGTCFVIWYFVSFYICNHLNGEKRAVFSFTLIFLFVSCDC